MILLCLIGHFSLTSLEGFTAILLIIWQWLTESSHICWIRISVQYLLWRRFHASKRIYNRHRWRKQW